MQYFTQEKVHFIKTRSILQPVHTKDVTELSQALTGQYLILLDGQYLGALLTQRGVIVLDVLSQCPQPSALTALAALLYASTGPY